jgi:superfamily II DNA or RNA helicase
MENIGKSLSLGCSENHSGIKTARLNLSSQLTLQTDCESLIDDIKKRLTIENPLFLENVRMNRWNGKTPEYLRFYDRSSSGLIVPRGLLFQVMSLCRQHGLSFSIRDHRRLLPLVDFSFNAQLRAFQTEAVDVVLKRDFGTLTAPTGSGKTVMALSIVAERRQPALIVVHTKELLEQWRERIQTFLNIPQEEIGIIGNGKKSIGERITVATVQSLVKIADRVSPYVGHLIVDECHHTPSRTFTDVTTAFDSKYMLGLSATPWRRDGLSRSIWWHLGDVVHRIEKAGLVEDGNILPFDVVTKETTFQSFRNASAEYTTVLSELTEDTDRNNLIVNEVAKNCSSPGVCLVLTDRKGHCGRLRDLLHNRGIDAEVLTSDRTTRERKDIVDRVNNGMVKTLIATGQLIGEGFDCPALSTLFIATPIKFDGRVIQYLGRVLRPAPGKQKATVYDFVDSRVGVLKAAAQARQRVYERQMEQAS